MGSQASPWLVAPGSSGGIREVGRVQICAPRRA